VTARDSSAPCSDSVAMSANYSPEGLFDCSGKDIGAFLKCAPNLAVERDGLQAALAGSLRASRYGRPSPLR
jgi:hypothetical protein